MPFIGQMCASKKRNGMAQRIILQAVFALLLPFYKTQGTLQPQAFACILLVFKSLLFGMLFRLNRFYAKNQIIDE